MRLTGTTTSARGFGPRDHLCWAYTDPGDMRVRMREFLADGLELGQRVSWIASGPLEDLVDDLRGVPMFDRALDSGAASVSSIDDSYPFGTVVDPPGQVGVYAEATADAVAAGFTGLRVVAEATPLVRTSAQREAFLRYEHLVDRYMTGHPFAAMCAYDRVELGDDVVTALACMHPNSNQGLTPFRVHASDDGTTAFAGDLDGPVRDAFARTLDLADPAVADGELLIDGTDLNFVDHRNLLILADHAARRGATAVLRTRAVGAARLLEVLGLSNVRVEVPA
ncbi:MEDS domain-containing protein [Umezawaea beigongshangensis]|uniref:MEDS domain-containing protein n=1 Tax=Umezawaea beigongshangensis TaxID=2780383 RepID=UPI0027DAC63B|nr:MEDS domain-containing protein [Umezawaea beigongshangensis]